MSNTFVSNAYEKTVLVKVNGDKAAILKKTNEMNCTLSVLGNGVGAGKNECIEYDSKMRTSGSIAIKPQDSQKFTANARTLVYITVNLKEDLNFYLCQNHKVKKGRNVIVDKHGKVLIAKTKKRTLFNPRKRSLKWTDEDNNNHQIKLKGSDGKGVRMFKKAAKRIGKRRITQTKNNTKEKTK